MTEFGIRHEADATGEWSDFVIDSVRLLNEQLAPEGLSFYFDEVNVAQKIIDDHKVWDMYGWAVSGDEAAEFERLWLADADESSAADGTTPMDKFCDVSVSWGERDGRPYARIVHYNPRDDSEIVLGTTEPSA